MMWSLIFTGEMPEKFKVKAAKHAAENAKRELEERRKAIKAGVKLDAPSSAKRQLDAFNDRVAQIQAERAK